jgi:ribose 5-phosphate isomerase B
MSIAANKFTGIRAALCHTTELAKLAREHNNANVLCIGARTHTKTQAKKILATFLTSHFEGGRHAKRLKKIR